MRYLTYNFKNTIVRIHSLYTLTQFQSQYINFSISYVWYVDVMLEPSTKTVFVAQLCNSGYIHVTGKAAHYFHRLFPSHLVTYSFAASYPTIGGWISPSALRVSSICPVVTTMSLVMSADSNPSQFSFLTRELLILLHSHLLATLKGLTLQPE